MPIGVFAQRSGLTSSALRFYADSGLLPPAEVDPVSGYRYYSADQVARATVLRQLREIAMPLTAVEAVLDAEADEGARLLDEHVAKVVGDAVAAQHKAAVIKSVLGDVPGLPVAVLKGPVLADAVEQALTACAREPGMPVLAGLRIEASHEAVTLTATDRYRLSTRTLVPTEPPRQTWAGTVDGDELRAAVTEIRRSALVRLEAVPHGIWLRVAGREDRYCRLLSEELPDHRLVLASLVRSPPVRRSRRSCSCEPWKNTPASVSRCTSPTTEYTCGQRTTNTPDSRSRPPRRGGPSRSGSN